MSVGRRPPGARGSPRILHLIAEFSAHEAMGRTITETARRVPGEHHTVTARVHDGGDVFASVSELGGPVATFPLGRAGRLAELLDRIRPDLVHVHAGALGPLQAALPVLSGSRIVLTMYAWPTLPEPTAWGRARLAEMWRSNVLAPRVAVATLLPPALLAAALRRSGAVVTLTPDPRVVQRLGRRRGLAVTHLPSGAPSDERRAAFDPCRPVIVFAGRAERVRGLDTLLAALPLVRQQVPGARLRLLLIPRPELPAILAHATAVGAAADTTAATEPAVGIRAGTDAVEVVTEPVPDLLGEFAAAQVGAWPFKFDYTTSPPAMAVAEAMCVGLPVVATDVACVRAVLESEVSGLAVPPAHPAALGNALVRLLRDEATWRRFAQAGPRAVRDRLGWEHTARVTAGAYMAGLAR